MRGGRVCALEAYLGGALPPEGGGVVTWRQEREQLQTTITVREMCFCMFFYIPKSISGPKPWTIVRYFYRN